MPISRVENLPQPQLRVLQMQTRRAELSSIPRHSPTPLTVTVAASLRTMSRREAESAWTLLVVWLPAMQVCLSLRTSPEKPLTFRRWVAPEAAERLTSERLIEMQMLDLPVCRPQRDHQPGDRQVVRWGTRLLRRLPLQRDRSPVHESVSRIVGTSLADPTCVGSRSAFVHNWNNGR